MWMMGYNEGAEFNLPDSFSGRKLRPLIPRPSGNATANNNGRNANGSSCLSRVHGTDLLAFNHHMATMTEQQSKREFSTQQVIVSSRWNPTPEQLQTLEELYRRGTRTPSTEEIQQITAKLRRYGKIEGKNVFYWFQNHKARERQKCRRQLESAPEEQQQQQQLDIEDIEKKESGANRTGFEAEQSQTKNWPPPTNCTGTLTQKTVSSLQRGAKTAAAVSDGWIQFDEGELQHRRTLAERNATWQMIQLSCSPHSNHINYITPVRTTMDPKLTKAKKNLNFFIAPPKRDQNLNHLFSVGNDDDDDAGYEKSQTLQLFPLRSDYESGEEKDTEISMASMKNNSTPSQFIEFLPLKN